MSPYCNATGFGFGIQSAAERIFALHSLPIDAPGYAAERRTTETGRLDEGHEATATTKAAATTTATKTSAATAPARGRVEGERRVQPRHALVPDNHGAGAELPA